jgi:ketosteroid isomerase-like protein
MVANHPPRFLALPTWRRGLGLFALVLATGALLAVESKQLTLHAQHPTLLAEAVAPLTPADAATSSLFERLAKSLRGTTEAVASATSTTPAAPNALVIPATLRVVGNKADSADVQAMLTLMKNVLAASNAHDSDAMLRYYAREYISGDKLKRPEVKALVEDTWQQYPDISYTSELLEIRVNGHWATLETRDKAVATAKNEAQLPNQTGKLQTDSRSLVFLRKVGQNWFITSDNVLYETALITYGEATNMALTLAAPDQVFAGEPYSAKLEVALPERTFAIAGINQEPLVFPNRPAEDKFRTVSADKNALERVFKANEANHNELVTATLGLTQVGRDEQQRPVVALKGIATVVKRVNVLPLPSTILAPPPVNLGEATTGSPPLVSAVKHNPDELVRTSADGRIELNPDDDPVDSDSTSSL